ncbi:transposase [Neolewinella litorea]|uniref:Transposase IS200-like domain-containing protein n=1 Tax=Neolewinella litorea TaxID=2562452 RepID=A0A4S4NHK3_9BACT|nr:transposase [Neolewinella litorea]THH35580.1 hypothetical protein E4021_15945 [Neolewinella litorea]
MHPSPLLATITDRDRGNISHFWLGHRPVHITYRLHGSIPRVELLRIAQHRTEALLARDKRMEKVSSRYHAEALAQETHRISSHVELELEAALHRGSQGPFHLEQTELRNIVLDSWKFLQKEIEVYAVCVMSNHVHAVVGAPPSSHSIDLGRLMDRHKSHTARHCNRILGATGQPFWATNYFDRTVRDGKFLTVMWYVLNNPVKSGLVTSWEAWPGTYLNSRYLAHFV